MAPRDASLGSQAWLCARKARVVVTPNSFCQIFRTICQESGPGGQAKLMPQDESGQDTTVTAVDTDGLSGHLRPRHQLHIRSPRSSWLVFLVCFFLKNTLLFLSFPNNSNLSDLRWDPDFSFFQNPWDDSKVQPGLRMSILSCFNILCCCFFQ